MFGHRVSSYDRLAMGDRVYLSEALGESVQTMTPKESSRSRDQYRRGIQAGSVHAGSLKSRFKERKTFVVIGDHGNGCGSGDYDGVILPVNTTCQFCIKTIRHLVAHFAVGRLGEKSVDFS